MGFGLDLLKGAASSATGSVVSGIMGLFHKNDWKKQMKQQFENEKEMMGLAHGYNQESAAKSQEYAKEMNAINYGQQQEMNKINYMQQNEMLNKQQNWASAEQQVARLKEAGLNPALALGLGATGAGGVSSGGSTGGGGGNGATVQGQGNPGTQAVAMGLQARGQEAQIKLAEAEANKANAEAMKIGGADMSNTSAQTQERIVNANQIEEATKLLSSQKITEETKQILNKAETGYKNVITEMQSVLKRFTEAKTDEAWYNARAIEMLTYKTGKEAEKIMKETQGLDIDVSVKEQVKDVLIKQQEANLANTMAEIFEKKMGGKLSEAQIGEVKKRIEAITNEMRLGQMNYRLSEFRAEEEIKAMWNDLDMKGQSLELQDARLTLDILTGGINAIGGVMQMGAGQATKVKGFR